MGACLERLCAAVQRWDAICGTPESEESGAWYVLGYVLERPEWRRLVEAELQELPSVAGMRRCLTALSVRGELPEEEIVPQIVRAVDAQLEMLSEDHAKVVRRRRRWLAEEQRHPDGDPSVARRMQALLTTESVWEEMRRQRLRLTAWREVTAELASC
ncbi:MAG TPA: hypothetical protein VH916_08800 [Dehalococcoidia bacterium]